MSEPNKPFLLGPFFVSKGEDDCSSDGVVFTGFSLEFSLAEDGPFLVPIYLGTTRASAAPYIDDYCFPIDYCPFEVSYQPQVEAKFTSRTQFISVARLLGAMFSNFAPSFDLTSVLQEFARRFPFSSLYQSNIPDAQSLVPALSAAGYALQSISSHGDTIIVDFCWLPELATNDKIATAQNIQSGVVQFRPKHDGSLGNGTWWELRQETIQFHLFERFKANGYKHPIECLSAKGIERCLAHFKWEPKHRMSKAELTRARFEMVKMNDSLWNDTRALAEHLKQSGLYSVSTSLSQVRKQVERTIQTLRLEAQKR